MNSYHEFEKQAQQAEPREQQLKAAKIKKEQQVKAAVEVR